MNFETYFLLVLKGDPKLFVFSWFKFPNSKRVYNWTVMFELCISVYFIPITFGCSAVTRVNFMIKYFRWILNCNKFLWLMRELIIIKLKNNTTQLWKSFILIWEIITHDSH